MYEVDTSLGMTSLSSDVVAKLRSALSEDNDRELSEDIFEFCVDKEIEWITLNNCSLTRLPDSVLRITSLKTLELDNNALSAIPMSLMQLINLEDLMVRWNCIETLPQDLFLMTKLKTLWLHYNKLKSVSESIGNLTNLRDLQLNSNQIIKLPVALHKLTKLRRLSVFDNGIIFPPRSIVESIQEDHHCSTNCAKSVKSYMKSYERRRSGTVQLFSEARRKDRPIYLSSSERFSYTVHTPFAVMDDYLFELFLNDYVLNDPNDGDW